LIAHNRKLNGSFMADSDHEDYRKYPLAETVFQWKELNQDFHSNPLDHEKVSKIAMENGDRDMDLRPYMIERPQLVSADDKFPKILNIFRLM
jgi:hypothetical protein